MLPNRRVKRESVIGRDGNIIFPDGFDNKIVSLEAELMGDGIQEVQRDMRMLSGILYQPGQLILDYEADKLYQARLIDVQSSVPGRSTSIINLVIEVDPMQKSFIKPGENISWDNADISWVLADFPWGGYTVSFNPTSGDTLTITNSGNYKALPIIKLSADSGNVTATLGTESFTYSNLDSTIVNVDSENHAVYTDAIVNKKSNHSGDFLELQPGENDIIITGTFVNLTIEFDYRHAWI